MLVDSHCHLDMLELSNEHNIADYLKFAQERGIEHFLCVCVALTDFPRMCELTHQFSNISWSVGLHPNEVPVHEPTYDELKQLALDPRIVAIGETGLDYFRTPEDGIHQQQERFRLHIRVARELQKPLIIHSRQAKADTLRILQEENAQVVSGVMHCFTEDLAMAQAAIELGFLISFSGIVTFKNALTLQEVAKKIPLSKMLVETDSPYLAPVPYRGKPNQPAYVREVAEFIAQLRGETFATIAQATTENFYKLFKLS